MKSFVGVGFRAGFIVTTIGGLACGLVVVATNAGAAATYLITFGMLAIVVPIALDLEDKQAEPLDPTVAVRPARERSGGARSTGSR